MNPTFLAVLVAAIAGIVVLRRWFADSKKDRLKDKNRLLSELHKVRNEYYRFSRSNNTDSVEHDRIITDAQSICLQVAGLFDKNCPSECIQVSTERDADLGTFRQIDAKCRNRILYIAQKRLTQSQVTTDVNPVECSVWGEYKERNEQALDDAIKFLEQIKI